MLNPITSQIMSRYQFSAGSENISSKQIAIPSIGTNGTSGARNGRLALGFFLRMTITAPQTITKAKRVQKLVIYARIQNGRNPAIDAKNRPVRIIDYQAERSYRWIV